MYQYLVIYFHHFYMIPSVPVENPKRGLFDILNVKAKIRNLLICLLK